MVALADMPEESAEKKSDVDDWVLAQLAAEQPNPDDPAAALRRAWHEAYTVYRLSYTTTAWWRLWAGGQERLVVYRYVLPDGSWRYGVGNYNATVADIADNYEKSKGCKWQKWAIIDRQRQLLYPVGSQMVSLTKLTMVNDAKHLFYRYFWCIIILIN